MPKSITIPAGEEYDPISRRVTTYPEYTLRIEHSLISISLWESKWHLSFFDAEKNEEQTINYIKCMTLNKNADDAVYRRLTLENIKEISAYINDPMTATTIADDGKRKSTTERVTSELIYYWMIAYNIPVEFEKWHINRLITLIRVCSEKQKPPKKKSRRQILEENRALNAARRAKLGTTG